MTDKNPDFSPMRMRARGFVSQGRIEDALGLYGDILKVAPEDAATYADRGTTFAMVKKTALALNDLNRAIELGYTDPSAYCTLATIYLEGGAYQKSLDCFDEALKLNPDQPFVYFNRARAYQTLGDISASIADLERCLTYDPDDALSAKIKERVAQLRARL
ncbi:TPA: tetratricopeptide repeat protein [Burkholderia cepacia]|uniref:tetratricopeptide repeat protein n=1 Tax=Burkholderia sp. COPS TaxID=2597663 RepID=UPI001CA4BF87|nr:tetratricopeptide repeat protein [Burkholderia sp. COPS]MBW5806652.1 tetratricopeptide repeat protein [Burkholderia sp. COPS]